MVESAPRTRDAHLLLLSDQTLFVPSLLLLLQPHVELLHLIHLLFLPLQSLLLHFLFLLVEAPLPLLLLEENRNRSIKRKGH